MDGAERLARRVAALRGCSRAEAERLILGGWVRVDGAVQDQPPTRVTEAHPALVEAWVLRLTVTEHPDLVGAHRDTRAQLEALLADGTIRGPDAETARQLLRPAPTTPTVPARRPPPAAGA